MGRMVRGLFLGVLLFGALAGCQSIRPKDVAEDARALQAAPAPTSVEAFLATWDEYQTLVDRQDRLVSEAECRAVPRGGRKPRYCMNALERALHDWRERREARRREAAWLASYDASDEAKSLDRVQVTGSRIDPADVVTNNQEPGADEGGLVKKSGPFLFLLEDGILHALRIERGGVPVMEKASSIALDDQPFDLDDTWYDELLVAGSHVLVLGFNYREDVAELQAFAFTPEGRLRRTARLWIRSGDYFSSSGYASRGVGDRLVTRVSSPIDRDSQSWDWPEWSRRDVPNPTWQPMVEPADLAYVPGAFSDRMAIHIVLRCDLAAVAMGSFSCDRRAVVGPEAAVFYVSAQAAYLGLYHLGMEGFGDPRFVAEGGYGYTEEPADIPHRTTIARIPFDDGSPLGMARIEGQVLDSTSFSERPTGLFVRTTRARLEAEGASSRRRYQVLLSRVLPSDWRLSPSETPTPFAAFPGWTEEREMQVRFTAKACWVSTHAGPFDEWGEPARFVMHRVGLEDGRHSAVEVAHRPAVLQPIDDHLLLVGDDRDGRLTASILDDVPDIARLGVMRWTGQSLGETRSQAINLRRRPDGGWLVAWPTVERLSRDLPDYWPQKDSQVADLQFVAVRDGALADVGAVRMQEIALGENSDEIAWYGDARVAFVGERVFAFSRNLVKEARYDGRRMIVTGVLDLSK